MGYKVKKRKDSPNYWIIGMVNGRRLDQSLRTTNKKQADELAHEKFTKALEASSGVRLKRNAGITLGRLMEKYSDYCKTNNEKTTWKKKLSNIKNLMSYFGDVPLNSITVEDVERFKAARLKDVGPATVNRDLATLKHALNLAKIWDYINNSPCAKVKLLKEPAGRTRYLTSEEADNLIAACSEWLKPVVITALHSGMRLGELLALEWKNVDFERRQIRIVKSKTGESRVVGINELLYNTLLGIKTGDGKVFRNRHGKPYSSISSSFKQVLKRAGITDFRFHDLRHTFASWLAMEGAPIVKIRDLLGHKTLQMTMRYAHLAPNYMNDVVELLTQNSHKQEKGGNGGDVTT